MRELADAERVRSFMRSLGREADTETTIYLTGGTTAVLVGWRATTVDVDLRIEPESERVLRAIARLKHELQLNVELASPGEFVPLPDGWEERSPFVAREGQITFRHFDPYAQALAKLERGYDRDVADVRAMVRLGLVEASRLRELFAEIEPELFRFPAVDSRSFRRAVDAEFPP